MFDRARNFIGGVLMFIVVIFVLYVASAIFGGPHGLGVAVGNAFSAVIEFLEGVFHTDLPGGGGRA